jgi:hypothetical protein
MSRTIRRKDSFGLYTWEKWDKKWWTDPCLGHADNEKKAAALYFSDAGVKGSGPAPKKVRKTYVRSQRHTENQKVYESVSKGKLEDVSIDGKHRHSATWDWY